MIYVFLADGFEEVEALGIVDILRRAELEVKTVGVGNRIITGAHEIPVKADITESNLDFSELEMIIFPGGQPGTKNLEKSQAVQKAITYCMENDIYIGAICAAPSILGHMGLLKGRKATCFPGYETQLEGAEVLPEEFVVCDGNIFTARGMGCTVEFAVTLVEIFCSPTRAKALKGALQCRW